MKLYVGACVENRTYYVTTIGNNSEYNLGGPCEKVADDLG